MTLYKFDSTDCFSQGSPPKVIFCRLRRTDRVMCQ